tara:strand:+ start:6189 stop:7661 length:1473 start_codon:yes stop_codon:yes gene_type:complete
MVKNVVANYIGKFWSLISALVFLPLWIDILGFENYTIISFTLVITSFTVFFDSGLTSTLSRQVARGDVTGDYKFIAFRTLEWCYLGIAFLIIVGFQFLVRPIVNNINVSSIDKESLHLIIRIVSIGIPFEMLFKFYLGGLLGFENHIKANGLLVAWGVLRNGMVTLAVYFYQDMLLFFSWQASSSVLFMFFARFYLLNSFTTKVNHNFFIFDRKVLLDIYRFALGMLLISFVAAMNSQMDKMLITKYISLDELGYYTLATSLAGGMLFLVNPIASALLPKFTNNFSTGKSLKNSYILSNAMSIIGIVIFSICASLVINSTGVIYVWTGDEEIAKRSGEFLSVFGFSYTILALQVIPYNYMISTGDTRFNNIIGIASLFVTIPGFIICAVYFGALYLALLILVIQLIIFILYVRRLVVIGLVTNWTSWIASNLLFPGVISFVFVHYTTEWLYTGGSRGDVFAFLFVQVTLGISLNLIIFKRSRRKIFTMFT